MHGGGISNSLPFKLLFVVSSSRNLDLNRKSGCAEWTIQRSQVGQTWLVLHSDAVSGDFGVQPTQEISSMIRDYTILFLHRQSSTTQEEERTR